MKIIDVYKNKYNFKVKEVTRIFLFIMLFIALAKHQTLFALVKGEISFMSLFFNAGFLSFIKMTMGVMLVTAGILLIDFIIVFFSFSKNDTTEAVIYELDKHAPIFLAGYVKITYTYNSKEYSKKMTADKEWLKGRNVKDKIKIVVSTKNPRRVMIIMGRDL